jgi:hypothetical protein
MEAVPMEIINTERGIYNTADAETGRKFTLTGVGVGKEFDITSGEGLEVIESEVDKLSDIDKSIYEKDKEYKAAMTELFTYTMLGKNKHDDFCDCLSMFVDFASKSTTNRVAILKRTF